MSPAPAAPVRIVGRTSSHFTRVTLIFARELAVPFELVPVYDLGAVDEQAYVGNPARKVPSLQLDGSILFGTENICRKLAELSSNARRIVWPEELRGDISRNAQELVWHAMAAQVQLAFGTLFNKLPADNLFFVKGRAGFEGALQWLEENVEAALAALPAERDLSVFEVTLYCLVEHLPFRGTLPLDPYPSLRAFASAYGERESARATAYRFDAPPAP